MKTWCPRRNPSMWSPGSWALSAAILAAGPAAAAARELPASGMIEGEPVFDVVPPDAIGSIDKPKFVSAEEARRFMRDDELVIGIASGDVVKAYSAELLDSHEIVNDHVGDEPVAVTW